jgi:hypothetical protein
MAAQSGKSGWLSLGMPDVFPKQAAEDFEWVAKNGCKGIYFDAFWNHWPIRVFNIM